MKTYYLLVFAVFLLASCKKDDDNRQQQNLYGPCKLLSYYDTDSRTTFNVTYRADNLIEKVANNVDKEHRFHYDADGKFIKVEFFESGELRKYHTVSYRADGTIDTVEFVSNVADSFVKQADLIYHYANGKVSKLSERYVSDFFIDNDILISYDAMGNATNFEIHFLGNDGSVVNVQTAESVYGPETNPFVDFPVPYRYFFQTEKVITKGDVFPIMADYGEFTYTANQWDYPTQQFNVYDSVDVRNYSYDCN